MASPPSMIDKDSKYPKHPSYPGYQGYGAYPGSNQEGMVYVIPSADHKSEGSPTGANGEEQVTKNAGSRWREDETEVLVEIWRNKICQTRWWKQSKGVRVNKEMWEEISQLLIERDIFRTASQCQIRMKNLLQFYRQAVDNRRSEKSWDDLPDYFDIVDRIMSRREGDIRRHYIDQQEDEDKKDAMIHHLQKGGQKRASVSEGQASSPKQAKHQLPTTYPAFNQWAKQPCCDQEPTKPRAHSSTTEPKDPMKPHADETASQQYNNACKHPGEKPTYHDQHKANYRCCATTPSEAYSHYRSARYQHPYYGSNSGNPEHFSRYLHEFLQLHFHQLQSVVEMERRRVEIEERRLKEQAEADTRNTAFLMEAVKILAEAFRKN